MWVIFSEPTVPEALNGSSDTAARQFLQILKILKSGLSGFRRLRFALVFASIIQKNAKSVNTCYQNAGRMLFFVKILLYLLL
jgi:hypothetical protein